MRIAALDEGVVSTPYTLLRFALCPSHFLQPSRQLDMQVWCNACLLLKGIVFVTSSPNHV